MAAEGSPLLAVEAARAVARGERDLPGGLREVVRAAFAELGATTRTLAQVAAVSGVPLTHDDAQALVGSSSAEVFAATVAAGVRAGLLTSGERNIDFRHALLREAAYAEMPTTSPRGSARADRAPADRRRRRRRGRRRGPPPAVGPARRRRGPAARACRRACDPSRGSERGGRLPCRSGGDPPRRRVARARPCRVAARVRPQSRVRGELRARLRRARALWRPAGACARALSSRRLALQSGLRAARSARCLPTGPRDPRCRRNRFAVGARSGARGAGVGGGGWGRSRARRNTARRGRSRRRAV